MLLLILFAFIAGIVTILSPCILPVLPIVLSGSFGGGKRRPFGIISGFILSFTFFTLFLASIVSATGVPADSVRTLSIVIMIGFGISLLLPQFQALTERVFSKIVRIAPSNQQGAGYWSGFLIGMSLGLIWTPCVGPILAAVISLALTGTVTGAAFFITLAYATGTAIPLLAITYGGRSLLQKVPWLLQHSERIQKAFGVLMIITALAIYFNVDRKFQTYILTTFPQYGVGLTQFEDNDAVREQLQFLNQNEGTEDAQGKTTMDIIEEGFSAPELVPGGEWFNVQNTTLCHPELVSGSPTDNNGIPKSPQTRDPDWQRPAGQVRNDDTCKSLSLKNLRGKVVLIDFWTYTCINCIRTLPYLKDWHAKYADKGLVIIGVHTPEFSFEQDPENVQQAIADFDLTYPVMQDNMYATWRAYNNRYWPAKYFIDKNGKIRSSHFGEGEYDESEKIIQELLAETGQVVDMPVENPTYRIQARTPELYLGAARTEYNISPESIEVDKVIDFTIPETLLPNTFAFDGKWQLDSERAMPKRNSTLVLQFDAQEVFLVMRPKAGASSGKVRVYFDGRLVTGSTAGEDVTQGTVTVDKNRLYKLIKLPAAGEHELRLEFLDDNGELFAFTFG